MEEVIYLKNLNDDVISNLPILNYKNAFHYVFALFYQKNQIPYIISFYYQINFLFKLDYSCLAIVVFQNALTNT